MGLQMKEISNPSQMYGFGNLAMVCKDCNLIRHVLEFVGLTTISRRLSMIRNE